MSGRRSIGYSLVAIVMLISTGALAACARRAGRGGSAETAAAGRTPTGAPKLERLLPDSVVVAKGMVVEVEIRGRRFDGNQVARGNTVSIGTMVLTNVPANAEGTVIRFVVPDEVRSGGEAPPAAWAPGRYAVTVRTAQGSSDTLYLAIRTVGGIRP